MLSWILGNTLVAACAAVGVALIARLNPSRPAVNHTLWLACLALLVMPPLPLSGQLGAGLRSLTQPSAEPVATKIVTPVWGDGSYSDQASMSDAWALAVGEGSLVPTGTAAASNGLTPLELELYLADLAAAEEAAAELTLAGRLSQLSPDWSWSTWLLALWGLGSLACFAWAQSRVHGFDRMVKRSPVGPVELDLAVADVAARLAVRAPRTRVLAGVGSPAVWCLGRPQLLWPASQVSSVVSDLGTRSLIAHELAHIARRDHWVARLDVLAVAALWWNPLFWLIRRELHAHAELACDALALSTFPGDRRRFAEALIEAHGRTTSAPLAMQGLCATTPDSKDFERRLTMIMKNKVSPGVSKGVAALALAGSVLLAPGIGSPTGEDAPQARTEAVVQASTELFDQAEQLFQAGDHPSALALFEELERHAPDSGLTQARLGYLKLRAGDVAAAQQHFERQLELGHQPATAAYNLACCDALGGDVEGGLVHLTQAMRLGFDRIDLLAKDPDLDSLRGSRSFEVVLQLSKTASDLRQRVAAGGDPTELRASYASLARIASEDGAVIRSYAMLVHDAGEYAASEKLFRRQAELGEAPAVAHYNVGCAQARQGRYDEAFDSLYTSAKLGFHYPAVVSDPDLADLRGDARFKQLAGLLSELSTGQASLLQGQVDGARFPGSAKLTDVKELEEASDLTDVTELMAKLDAFDADLTTQKARLATIREDGERAQVVEQLRSQLAAKDGLVRELEVVLEQLRQDDEPQRFEVITEDREAAIELKRALGTLRSQAGWQDSGGGVEPEARLEYERALSSAEETFAWIEALRRDGSSELRQFPDGELPEDMHVLWLPATVAPEHRERLGMVELHALIEGAATQAGEQAPGRKLELELERLPRTIEGQVVIEGGDLRADRIVIGGPGGEVEGFELRELKTADKAKLEALGYLGSGKPDDVLRVLTERGGDRGQELRLRVVTGADGETRFETAEAAEAAEAAETVRVRSANAEAQRAIELELKRALEQGRREAADPAEALKEAKAQVEALQREAEIHKLKREIERLESELEKAKAGADGEQASTFTTFGDSYLNTF